MKKNGFVLSVTIMVITVISWFMMYHVIHIVEEIHFFETLIEARR